MSEEIDLDKLRAGGEAEARLMALVEAACLSALDVRREILCILSAEYGEWSDGGGGEESLIRFSKQYHCFMRQAFRRARDGWQNQEKIVDAMMTRLAEREGHASLLPWTGGDE